MQLPETEIQRIKAIRYAGSVTRYHTSRSQRSQSVAEHSWGVAQLVLAIVTEPSSELIKAALNHDLPELWTGDVPAPTKREWPEIKDALEEAEAEFHTAFGTSYSITDHDKRVLKFCDLAELVLWSLEEFKLGNRYAEDVIVNGLEYLDDIWKGEDMPVAAASLKEDLVLQYTDAGDDINKGKPQPNVFERITADQNEPSICGKGAHEWMDVQIVGGSSNLKCVTCGTLKYDEDGKARPAVV